MLIRALHPGLVVVAAAVLAGCEGAGPSMDVELAADGPAMAEPAAAAEASVPDELNSAYAAARTVAAEGPVADVRTRQEIALHATLYRLALDLHAGRGGGHYLLDPSETDIPRWVTCNSVDFRLRVLAALASVGARMAWESCDPENPDSDHLFPGSRHRAMRLSGRVIRREPELATVVAQVSCRTPEGGGSSVVVTVAWDGVEWMLVESGVKLRW